MPSPNNLNLLGAQIDPPDNPGTWIGKLWRAKICAILTCLLKPRLVIPIDNGNGIPVPQDAVITMGRNGWTAVFPALAAAGASGTASSTVPFSGTTDPPGGLAVGNYVVSPTPSLYVNLTTPSLWVCTISGTNATSVWAQISGGSAGGNFNLRGLWSPTPTSPYMTFDAVLLQGGTSGGMYWSTVDNNSNSPDSGVGWTQLSTVLGSWL